MIALARTPRTIVNWNLKDEHSYINPDLRGGNCSVFLSNKYDEI